MNTIPQEETSRNLDPAALQAQIDALAGNLPGALAKRIKSRWTRELKAYLRDDDGPLEVLTADRILTTQWPDPVWAVPGVGKSWLALQFAQAVAAGGITLGERVECGPILYLALEDPPRRLQDRMRKQLWPASLDADFLTLGTFADQVGDLRNGGGERLARQIEQRGYRLVVVDTLSRSIAGDQDDVVTMTLALTPIQEIAHAHNCAALLVDHHRKGSGFEPDAVADILGSTAKGAVADTILGLYRERGKAGAKLAIAGREVEERTLALTWDGLTGCWQSEGDAGQLEVTAKRQEILDALADLELATLADLVEVTGRGKGNVYKSLQDLVNAGLIRRTSTKRGEQHYCLARDRIEETQET
jgi:hypothetical protein